MQNGNGSIPFRDWQIEPELNRLLRAGEERKLEPKAMDVLVLLIEHQGHVVSTGDILDRVWAKQLVEEGAVHQRIAKIRRALGDDPQHPRYIENIPRRGYRAMVGPATANGRATEATGQQWLRPWMLWSAGVSAAGAAGLSLLLWLGIMGTGINPARPEAADPVRIVRFTVQPIRDLSADQQLGTAAGALTQEVRHQLARYTLGVLPDRIVEVAPSQSSRSRPSPGSAGELGYVLEGTLDRLEDGVRLQVELTDTSAGDLLWILPLDAQDHDRAALNRLASQVARHAAWYTSAIGPGGRGPKNRAAHAAFSEFMKLYGGERIDDTLFWLHRTLELDPTWRGGWEELAWSWLSDGETRRDASRFREAVDAHERGDPASFLRIELKAYVDGDLEDAEVDARKFTLGSSDGMAYGYAWLMLHSGLHREGEAFFRWFNAQMPHHPGGIRVREMTSALRGDALGAVEASRELAGATAVAGNVLYGAAWGLPRLGRLAEARTLHDKVTRALPELRPGSATALSYQRFLATLAFEIAIAEEDLESARAAAQRQAELGSHAAAGISYLRLDDPRAEQQLRLAEPDAPFIRRDWLRHVAFTPPELRTHPAFVRLQDALGYTEAWRREFCRRASTMPPHTHVTCDPSQFEVPDDGQLAAIPR